MLVTQFLRVRVMLEEAVVLVKLVVLMARQKVAMDYSLLILLQLEPLDILEEVVVGQDKMHPLRLLEV